MFSVAHLRLLLVVLVAVAARALAFGNPVVHVDEEFYLTVARAMWGGAWPYVDIWDRKPVGLFLLFMPAAALPGAWAVLAYQGMALACVVIAATIVGRLAELAGWQRGATLAAIAYVLWLDPLGGVGGQSPVFYNAGMAIAALLVVTDGARRWRGIAAMAIVGLVLQIKYSAVFEGMFFGCWLLAADWRTRRRPLETMGYAVVLVLVAMAPTLIAAGTYAAIGQADAFVYANFTSILARNPDPWRERLTNAGILVLILSPLVAMACAPVGRAEAGSAQVRTFARSWFAVALGAVIVFGGWFDHYGLPVVLPGALCSAAFFARRRWATAAILGAVAIAGTAAVAVNRHNRGDGAQLAALADAVGNGPGCLYVYSGPVSLYQRSGRCALTRYWFPSHLNRAREAGAIGVDQRAEVARILAARPAVIVMRPPFGGERPDVRALVLGTVHRDYRLVALRPMGTERLAVYRRRCA